MPFSETPRDVVAAIILRNGKRLFSKEKDAGFYKNIGGGVEEGETYEQALEREFEEEIIGAEITSIKDPNIKEYGKKTESGIYNIHYFDVDISGEPQPNEKLLIEKVAWIDPILAVKYNNRIPAYVVETP